MRLKLRVWLLSLLAVGAAVCGGAAIKASGAAGDGVAEPPPVRTQKESDPYWLYDSGGYIAIYGEGKERLEITDIETDTLNDYDRELLQNGIPAQSKAELLSLLEDFSS